MYLLGWIIAQALASLKFKIQFLDTSLTGTIVSLLLFVIVLPYWARIRWRMNRPWDTLGVSSLSVSRSIFLFWKGFSQAFLLILLIALILLITGRTSLEFNLDFPLFLNAVLLCIGVGFAEELIFRGWLLSEFSYSIGPKKSILLQSLIFSLVHIRLDLGLLNLISLLIGLFLLGLVLAIKRVIDRGSLWGCIGLHGGFVGIWFLFTSSFLNISYPAPFWLLGPGNYSPNPIGGIIGIVSLIILLYIQLISLETGSITSLFGTVNASSKVAEP